MRTVNLVSVTLEGFRSFRSATTIEFKRSAGFRFMTGRNESTPSLGANGAGKSSLWEGLTWINYGSSIKDQRASDLTTWGARKPRGTCVWDIDGERAIVERSGNPNYLALNSEPVIQQVIDRILGRNKKQFVQTVIYGQSARTFIDLSIPERSSVLDDVLDLNLWLTLSDTAGKKVSIVEKQVDEIARQIAYEDGRLASIPDEQELITRRDQWNRDKQDRINNMITEVETAESVLVNLIETSSRLENRAKEHDDIEQHEIIIKDANKKLEKLNREIGVSLGVITMTQKTINFFTDNPEQCPTCGQTITTTFARRTLKQEKTDLDTATKFSREFGSYASNITKLRDEHLAIIDKKQRIRDYLLSQIRETGTKAAHQNVMIQRMADDINRFGNEQNPWIERIEQSRIDIAAINETRSTLITQRQTLEGSSLIDSFWRDGFKRVRLFEINRILTHLELEIENAAGLLGLFNWRINVSTETENKTGGVKHGVQIQITSPEASAPWESWSGGEGQRIRLAVAIGFAGLIERMTGVQYGFEVWDEPSSFLSPEGIEDFLSCMRTRVDNERKTVWLIDCGVMTNTGFDEVYQMTKTRDGSHLDLITSDE